MIEPTPMSQKKKSKDTSRINHGEAIALYEDGTISAAQLEAFRIAASDSNCDPMELLRQQNLPQVDARALTVRSLVRALVAEIDVYFSKLTGPGIAEVRSGLANWRHTDVYPPSASRNSITEEFLPKALSACEASEPNLSALIAATSPHLHWMTYDKYDISKIGESFARSHSFCTIMGDDGAIKTKDFDLGLFIIAPHVLYRDHNHAAPELYAPLTGPHGWRFEPDAPLVIKPAHTPVWNEPFHPHLTKVGAVPFLAVYCWTRDNHIPAEVLQASDWATLESLRL
jgi:hypothetical protein